MGFDAAQITVLIAGAFGPIATIAGLWFSNRQKTKEQSQGSVEWVVKQTTELYEECKKRVEKMSTENKNLRSKNAELNRKHRALMKKLDDKDKRG